jgi:PBP4 family serine-type D-alanyl-D-alanine carboxypeptidase
LRQLGIRSIAGRVIGDDDAFDDEEFGAGWMWDDMDQAFSAGVGALQINAGAMTLIVTPGVSEGAPATLSLSTDGSGLAFRNRVITAAAGTAPRILTRRLANRKVLEVSGSVAVAAAPVQRAVAVENPTLYFVASLRRTLTASGIDVRGEGVDIDDLAPANARERVLLFSHRSPPLSELAHTLMKVSQNQYAETFLKTLGANAGSPTFERGRQVVRETMESWGVSPSDLVYADGSGLSRYDLVSAEALVVILTHVADDARLKQPFEASLPVAGVAGTMSERLRGTSAAGTVRAKTGSMANVRSISGYMQTAEGEPVVFSIVTNNYGLPAAEIDRVADALMLGVAQFRR